MLMDALAVAALASALALAVSLLLAWLFAGLGTGGLAMDVPNARSSHDRPVPRVGGVAIGAGVAAGWWYADVVSPVTAGLALALLAVSLLDDLRGLPVALRLLAHVAAAALLVGFIDPPGAPWLWPMLALAVVWMTNLYNFMDGSDGLAGGMACFGFGCYALAAWLAGDAALAAACAVVVAAALGFLAFNRHPARLFMGDTGAIALGFLAGAFGLSGWQQGNWSPLFPLLVFSPFIADASVTVCRRWLRGEKVWQAHREHYYQRLLRMGLGHRGVARLGYAVMLVAGGLAVVAQAYPVLAWPVVLAWFALLGLGMMRVDRAWKSAGLD
jgi:UDP-N-acetylmuramyl pentapeptide phosphotransferase/UDP-N-acetylglucosamine-1-phosphate transferase